MRDEKDMPNGDRVKTTFNEDLPFLGEVKQKAAKTQWWRPWIHQLLLYVGTARQREGRQAAPA